MNAQEKSHQVYLGNKARREELNGKDKKMFETIEKVKLGRYSANCDEALTIAKVYNNNALNSFHHIFCFGFLKGVRAEKARQKRIKSSKISKRDWGI